MTLTCLYWNNRGLFASAVPFCHWLNELQYLLCHLWIRAANDSLKSLYCDLFMMTTNVSLTQNIKRNVNDNLFMVIKVEFKNL